MAKRSDNGDSQEVNSRILLMILDELRYIRKRMDIVLEKDPRVEAPSPSCPQLLDSQEPPEDTEVVKAEIVDTSWPPDPPPNPEPEIRWKTDKDAPRPDAPEPILQPDPQPASEPKQSNEETFGLQKPNSPEEEAELFAAQKQRIENMMSLAKFTQAEKLAQALLAVMPDSTDAENLLETVRRESSAFRTEHQARLFTEFQRWTESRQWLRAQSVARQLIEQYPASDEGQTVLASMSTVDGNALLEETRNLRDRIRDMVKRKRYSEAIELAEDLIRRFPMTQAARQLKTLLPDLKRRNAHFH